jgi:asparagine synthase (glutamine-hydrolysing)
VENPKIFRQLLNDSIEISQGIIKKDALIQLNDMIEGKVPYSFVIWRLICFGRWMKIFNIKINDENRS